MSEECMLPLLHRWRRDQVGNYRQKWRHIPLLRQRVEGGLFYFYLFIFLRQTLTPLEQRIRGPGVVAGGAGLVRRKPAELVIQREIWK